MYRRLIRLLLLIAISLPASAQTDAERLLDACMRNIRNACVRIENDQTLTLQQRAAAKQKLQQLPNTDISNSPNSLAVPKSPAQPGPAAKLPAQTVPAPKLQPPAPQKEWSLSPPSPGTSLSDGLQYHLMPLLVTIVFVIGGLIALFFLVMKLSQNRTEARISEGMPAEGPMKVNLEIEPRGSKHRLHIHVKMPKSDWDAVRAAGLGGYSLFEHKGVTELDNFYAVGHLLRVKHVDFDDLPDALAAKEAVVTGLHALRTRIDQQKEFAATPTQRKESLEI